MFERLFGQDLDDTQLIEKAKTDKQAFAQLYERFSDGVYRFARQRVATDQDAEDIVSETFMAVVAGLPGFDTTAGTKVRTRIFTIANYKIIDYLRGVYAKPDVFLDDWEHIDIQDDDLLEKAHATHVYEEIMRFVQTFSDKQKTVFLLRYSEGIPNKDIATMCDIDEKTVSSLISMITKKIRQHLDSMHFL